MILKAQLKLIYKFSEIIEIFDCVCISDNSFGLRFLMGEPLY